jgi:hypothetical protein
MKRWIEYAGFLLLGALIMVASIASASYVTGIPGGWRPIGIFTEPDETPAGQGQIFTAEGDVVENRCYFVRVPDEGALYFDPENPTLQPASIRGAHPLRSRRMLCPVVG